MYALIANKIKTPHYLFHEGIMKIASQMWGYSCTQKYQYLHVLTNTRGEHYSFIISELFYVLSLKKLHISLKMSIFVHELRQGLDSLDYEPADLAATKNMEL